MSVVILSPSKYSQYTISVAEELLHNGIKIDAIVVKRLININRIIAELRKNPKRTLGNIKNKLLFRKLIPNEGLSMNKFFADQNYKCQSLDQVGREFNVPIIYTKDFHSSDVIRYLGKLGFDILVFTGGGILKKEILQLPRKGAINCHMGILPKYRGMDCPYWAILDRDFDNIGLSTHFMNEGIDTGEILDIQKLDLSSIEKFTDIENYLEFHMPKFLIQTVLDVSSGNHLAKTQKKDDGKQFFIIQEKEKKEAERIFNKYKDRSL